MQNADVGPAALEPDWWRSPVDWRQTPFDIGEDPGTGESLLGEYVAPADLHLVYVTCHPGLGSVKGGRSALDNIFDRCESLGYDWRGYRSMRVVGEARAHYIEQTALALTCHPAHLTKKELRSGWSETRDARHVRPAQLWELMTFVATATPAEMAVLYAARGRGYQDADDEAAIAVCDLLHDNPSLARAAGPAEFLQRVRQAQAAVAPAAFAAVLKAMAAARDVRHRAPLPAQPAIVPDTAGALTTSR